ncbi:tetratricopeptide repeat protein [Pseudoalteromonas spongiae]|uniref:tetratricopeptide repeat protein n=1 Tax=Pseudoalteromonas spongiae TaxID=298657 RepID=UPI0037365B1C
MAVKAQYTPQFDNECTRAFNDADYINARYKCAELAEGDNAEANFILAALYAKGQGVVKNKQKALEYLTLADEQGHAEATFNLALTFELGKVVGVDVEKRKRLAFDYYLKAARNGSINAQRKLASRYSNETSVVYQPEKAAQWLTAAVEQDDNKAKLELGALYLKGEGVSKDQARGLALIKGSADAGYDKAQFIYATLIFKTEPQESIRYYQRAAKQGNGFAAHNLASLYFNGEYLAQDKSKANEYALLALEQGIPQAEMFLITEQSKQAAAAHQNSTRSHDAFNFDPPQPSQNLSGFVLQFGKYVERENALRVAQQLECKVVEMAGFYYAINFDFATYAAAKKRAQQLVQTYNIAMPYIRVASDFNFAAKR